MYRALVQPVLTQSGGEVGMGFLREHNSLKYRLFVLWYLASRIVSAIILNRKR